MKKSLTWEQKRIVSHENGNALVMAVPGSGKTITLVKRVERLVKSGIDPRSILILMYNKSVSQTFAAKLRVVLKSNAIPEVRTFHSLALKLVSNAEHQQILKKKELVSSDDYRYAQIVRQSYREGADHKQNFIPSDEIEEFELFITRCRAEAVTPDEAASDPTFSKSKPEHIRAYKRYCDLLEEYDLRTFDDCLIEAGLLLRGNQYLGMNFKHIIVDEYQDVNLIQHEMIRSLAKEDTSVMAVGDINQCIYEWRGARPDFIGGLFEKHFKNAKVYHLSCTFRFGHTLSLMSNSVIRRNSTKLSKLCISHPSTPKTNVRIYSDNSLPAVLSQMSEASGTQAILSRTKASLAEAEMVLRLCGLPFRYLDQGASSLYKRAEVGLLVVGALMCVYGNLGRLENHPEKQSLISGFLDGGGFQWKKGQRKEALNGLMTANTDLWAVLGGICVGSHYQKERFEKLTSVRQKDNEDALAIGIFYILEKAGYFTGVGSAGVTRRNSNDKYRGIEKIEKLLKSSKVNAGTFLNLILNSGRRNDDCEPFVLSTLHGCKGLEWDNVAVIGLHEKDFPCGYPGATLGSRSPVKEPMVKDGTEEERRLFYVGITRAKRQLNLMVPADEGLAIWLKNAWDSTPKKTTTALRFVYEAGWTACALTSDAIYNNSVEVKQKSDFSKFHQWYLRDLQRLKV
ncbi:ATP-dependent helicase [Halomonas sp. Bachu 37]|uniref:ATP-dependent helicase n=1 Tax=Halomonas kashgarensis TaxID=3084920 RepID=UPI003216C8B7